MKDAFNFWFSGLKEKFSNPVIFTFMWLFVLWNWKPFAILIFDVGQKVSTRIEAFANTDLALWQPLALTATLVLITPFLNTIPNVIKDWAEVFYCWLKKWQFGVQMVSQEKHNAAQEALNDALSQRNDSRNRVHELEKQIADKDSLLKSLDDTLAEVKSLRSDKDELTTKLNDMSIKHSEAAQKVSEKSETIANMEAKAASNSEFKKTCRSTNKQLREKLEKLKHLLASMSDGEKHDLIQVICSAEDLLNETFGDPKQNDIAEITQKYASMLTDSMPKVPGLDGVLGETIKLAKAQASIGTLGDAIQKANLMIPPESKLPHSTILSSETIKQLQKAQENIPKVTVPTLDHLKNFKKLDSE